MKSTSSKEISWVDMYRKFGAIYKGVDDNKFFEETGKFVQCQVQTMGVNIKKFCAEIMHEFLDPPEESLANDFPTDSSLNNAENIPSREKVKLDAEEFSPFLDYLSEIIYEASLETGTDEHIDASVNEIREINESGKCNAMDPPPLHKILQCESKIKENPCDTDACCEGCTSTSVLSLSIVLSELAEKASTSQYRPSDLVANFLPAEYDTVDSKDIKTDDSTKCEDKTGQIFSSLEDSRREKSSNVANLEASVNGKGQTGMDVDFNDIKIDDSTNCEDKTGGQIFSCLEDSQTEKSSNVINNEASQPQKNAESTCSTLGPADNLEASVNGKGQTGRNVDSKDMKIDDSTNCEEKTGGPIFSCLEDSQTEKSSNVINIEASQPLKNTESTCSTPCPVENLEASVNGKGQAGRNEESIHPMSAVSSYKVEDDDYEPVAYSYEDIDSEMNRGKGTSPLNQMIQIHGAYMDNFVRIDGYESEWELL